jgi:hypothetical protein
MGILDDAIREHLNLKRQRGADPAEIERAEHEALGPARRAPEPSEEDLFDHDVGPDEAPAEAPGEELGEEWNQPFGAEPAPSVGGSPPGVEEHDESWAEPPAPAGVGGETADVLEPEPPVPVPLPEEPPGPKPVPASPNLNQETVEYDVEAEEHREPGEEDVLEETPEFLQDTPEHDRLWFEQRGPKDFDFDG